jgi:hypothetical protein
MSLALPAAGRTPLQRADEQIPSTAHLLQSRLHTSQPATWQGGRPLRPSRLWSAQSLAGNPAGPPPPRRTSRLGRVARGAAFSGGLPWPDSAREGGAGPGRRGRTNRQIGQALFITPKTASVHVSRSSPSWGPPVAVRRPRSPTDSASTSDDALGRGRSREVMRSTTAVRQRRDPGSGRIDSKRASQSHAAAEESWPPVNAS